jgi:hypothetical protein
LVSIADTVIE